MKTIQHNPSDAKSIARYYAKMAVRALYDEISLHPKPGLVSFIDSGAHTDMDGALFFRSLFGLRHYFFRLCLHAAQGGMGAELVKHGLEAEATMHAITKGVNTHRGAIFALGILCASAARLSSQGDTFSSDVLQAAIVRDWANYLQHEHRNEHTHGSMVKRKYALADAKYLAINGYACVFTLFEELAHIPTADKTFFGVLAYKKLLLHVDDINIVYRKGLEGLRYARQQVEQSISPANREQSIANAIRLHQVFSRQNISPGGVADMLSLLFFLRRVFVNKHPSSEH